MYDTLVWCLPVHQQQALHTALAHNPLITPQALRRRLLARKHFVPWGSNKPFTLLRISLPPPPSQDLQQQTAVQPPPEDVTLPPGVEPLVLWEPAEAGGAASADDTAVEVDAMLTR